MAMVVKNNMGAVKTLNTLNKNSKALSKSLAKVSSGMKITGAEDDSSAYAISERMRVQIRGLGQDTENVQNGRSLLKIAGGAIDNIVEELRSLRELALNAANDHNTDLDRATIQKEFDQRMANIDNIAQETSYNGKILLDGKYAPPQLYDEYRVSNVWNLNLDVYRMFTRFTYEDSTGATYTCDASNPGEIFFDGTDIVDVWDVGYDDGSFSFGPVSYMKGIKYGIGRGEGIGSALDFQWVDWWLGNELTYTMIQRTGAHEFEAYLTWQNGSGGSATNDFSFFTDDEGNEWIKDVVTDTDGSTKTISMRTTAIPFTEDGIYDMTSSKAGKAVAFIEFSDGTPAQKITVDFRRCRITYKGDSYADPTYSADAYADHRPPIPDPIVKYSHEGNPLVIQQGTKANQALNTYLNDMRIDALGLANTMVTSRQEALYALWDIDDAIEYALDEATNVGAYISRLEFTEANLVTTSENVQSSESTIRDADMAKEMTAYTKHNVLVQAAQSMLAQANQNASSVLSLLQ